MKFKTLIALFLLLFISASQASEKVNIKVKGMVCAYCSTGIEKTFKGQKEVENVSVNMDKKIVNLILKKDMKLADEKIKTLITDSGFNVAEINRVKTVKSKTTKKNKK